MDRLKFEDLGTYKCKYVWNYKFRFTTINYLCILLNIYMQTSSNNVFDNICC